MGDAVGSAGESGGGGMSGRGGVPACGTVVDGCGGRGLCVLRCVRVLMRFVGFDGADRGVFGLSCGLGLITV